MADALHLYRGKRVFVTGHTGFKGSWLAFLLNELGAEVTGYALPSLNEINHYEQLGLRRQIYHVDGDIRDLEKLTKTIQEYQPEFVFHLAAQALVKQSYANPVETFSTNVMGSVNVLDAIRATPSVKVLVYVTSDKCYENNEWVWGYRENDRLGGFDPYSASKAGAENVFFAYWRSFLKDRAGFGAATARAGNVIGGGDWAVDRIVPDCVRASKEGAPVMLRNPLATRPWQHVLEPLAGYLLLGANLFVNPEEYCGSWNFGPSSLQCRTVGDIARYIVRYFGRSEVLETVGIQHHEAQLLQLNCDKAHQLLGWYPRWDVEKTLDATCYWYKSVMDEECTVKVTGKQIREYFHELA